MKMIKINRLVREGDKVVYDVLTCINIDNIVCFENTYSCLESDVDEYSRSYEIISEINSYEFFTNIRVRMHDSVEDFICAESFDTVYNLIKEANES